VAGPGSPTDPLRTAVAAQGVELSALFFVVFEHSILPGAPPRQPRLLAPPGQSTAGGKLARQHVTLEPADGQDGPNVVVGWADMGARWAQLRSFTAVNEAYFQRFGQHLELKRGPYNQFIRDAANFLREQGFAVEVAESRSSAPGEAAGGSPWLLFGLVLTAALVLGIAIGIGWVVLRGT